MNDKIYTMKMLESDLQKHFNTDSKLSKWFQIVDEKGEPFNKHLVRFGDKVITLPIGALSLSYEEMRSLLVDKFTEIVD